MPDYSVDSRPFLRQLDVDVLKLSNVTFEGIEPVLSIPSGDLHYRRSACDRSLRMQVMVGESTNVEENWPPLGLERDDEDIRRWVDEDLAGIEGFLNSSYSALSEILLRKLDTVAGPREAPHDHDSATVALAMWTMKRLYSGLEKLREGMLSEAVILMRAAQEGLVLLAYFYRMPERATDWLNGKMIPQKEARDFLNPTRELANRYTVQSSLSHPSYSDAISFEVERTPDQPEGTGGMSLGGVRNPANLRAAAMMGVDQVEWLLKLVMVYDAEHITEESAKHVTAAIEAHGAEIVPKVKAWEAWFASMKPQDIPIAKLEEDESDDEFRR